MKLIDIIRNFVRKIIRKLAYYLNLLSRGKIQPNFITIFGSLMHIPIALLIASGSYFKLAAAMLIIFGLFDTLDGELARLQNRASPGGMLLDASTDRMKEIILYTGIAYFLSTTTHPQEAVVAVIACGSSIVVSYVKAKGEAAFVSLKNGIGHHELNRMFKDGFLTFELRMVLLIIGLLFHILFITVCLIAVLATLTSWQRLILITKKLNNVT